MDGINRAMKRSGWLVACLSVFALCGALKPSGPVWAQTPYSQGRLCGAPNQTQCPPTPVIITPWLYGAQQPFVAVPAQWFSSIADVVSWYQGEVLTTWCTASYTGSTPQGTPSYTRGIDVQYTLLLNFADTLGTGCSQHTELGGTGGRCEEQLLPFRIHPVLPKESGDWTVLRRG